jgi:hypothetical protein
MTAPKGRSKAPASLSQVGQLGELHIQSAQSLIPQELCSCLALHSALCPNPTRCPLAGDSMNKLGSIHTMESGALETQATPSHQQRMLSKTH